MGISANDLCQHVIRPTLDYLSCHSPAAEALLLGAAACQSALGSALDDRRGHGLYRIASERHQQLWDQYLALDLSAPAGSAAWPASMPSSPRRTWN